MPNFETSPGVQLHYQVDDFTDPWTEPETILLLHGNAESRRDVKNNLGYVMARFVYRYQRLFVSRYRRYLLATNTRSEPTVFATVMRTYLACWQGNFGLDSMPFT